eukprot:366134-Chlamydomonas_euryale.AAC.1
MKSKLNPGSRIEILYSLRGTSRLRQRTNRLKNEKLDVLEGRGVLGMSAFQTWWQKAERTHQAGVHTGALMADPGCVCQGCTLHNCSHTFAAQLVRPCLGLCARTCTHPHMHACTYLHTRGQQLPQHAARLAVQLVVLLDDDEWV